MKKTLVGILSAVMCLIFVSTNAFAEGETSSLTPANSSLAVDSLYESVELSAQETYITINECMLAGEKWIAANYPDGTEIRSVIPIGNLDNQLNGYCINFSTDGEPAGYLVLNAEKYADTYIKEFALDGNGIYDELAARISINSRAITVAENVIYTTSPYQYAIKYTNGNETLFYNSDASVMPLDDEIKFYGNNFSNNEKLYCQNDVGTNKKEIYDAFFYGSSLTSFSSDNDKVISKADTFVPYTMDHLRDGTNLGNCGPTAATNICGYYYYVGKKNILKDRNVQTTYTALVDAVNFDRNGEDGTSYGNLQSGLKSYIEECGYSVKIDDYWFDWWSDFKRDFDNGYPNIMFLEGKRLYNGSWETVGHFVVGVGYRIMNDNTRYIRVYDGWYTSSSRFISFDGDALTTIKGAAVNVS